MKGTWVTISALVLLLLAAIAVAYRVWNELAEVSIGTHGWIALTLGVVATIALGSGLMFLVFYSNRRGYDDEAGRD